MTAIGLALFAQGKPEDARSTLAVGVDPSEPFLEPP